MPEGERKPESLADRERRMYGLEAGEGLGKKEEYVWSELEGGEKGFSTEDTLVVKYSCYDTETKELIREGRLAAQKRREILVLDENSSKIRPIFRPTGKYVFSRADIQGFKEFLNRDRPWNGRTDTPRPKQRWQYSLTKV